jgi:hypothetical protein
LRPDGAHQQHGVEIDVGVQERERGGLRQHRGARVTAGARRFEPARPPGARERACAVGQKEQGTAAGQQCRQLWCGRQRLACAQHAQRHQQRVGERTEQHDRADMLAHQALTQHEGVLGADRDDQAGREGEAGAGGGHEGGIHGANCLCPAGSIKLKFLTLMKHG